MLPPLLRKTCQSLLLASSCLLLLACQSAPPKVEYATSLPAPVADIPLRMLMGKPYVEVQINGKGPYLLQFDTGARLMLTSSAAAELGVRAERWFTLIGNANKGQKTAEGDVAELSLAGFVLRNQPVAIHDFNYGVDQSAYATPPIIGAIGRELFQHMPCELDFVANRLRLYPVGTPVMQAGDHVERFAWDRYDLPRIRVNGSLGSEDATLDTGGNITYYHSGKIKDDSPNAMSVSREGVDGSFMTKIQRIEQLQLFGQTLQQPLIESRRDDAFSGGDLLGTACLRGLRIKIDWEQRLLGVNGTLPDSCANPYGRSGIQAYKSDAGFYVDYIQPESAIQAGLPLETYNRPGAIISKINGKPATEFSQAEFDAINAGQQGRAMSIEFQGYTGSFYVLFDKPEQSGAVAAK
ncbi:retropepsin-like aspartic protease [Chitinilyticum piscinae]|uniref:Retropepsin-like domain-containing protein n=1 Tax=Chitinilyticum piscinae TaxID=2866724 RepID=A0A8J7FI11_9NEIS|nr:retropepsin-like aspartic protease [Chitinilyticum piscinae]MBE9608147.1 retropepsin-like domain-containing protein [Chitinilyticum piscinae]